VQADWRPGGSTRLGRAPQNSRLSGAFGVFGSHRAQLQRSQTARIATVLIRLMRGVFQPQPPLNFRRIGLRSAQCDRGVTHRSASMSGSSRRALYNLSAAAFPIRSPPHQSLGVSIDAVAGDSRRRVSAESRPVFARRSAKSERLELIR
jgi:hypothetical protein